MEREGLPFDGVLAEAQRSGRPEETLVGRPSAVGFQRLT